MKTIFKIILFLIGCNFYYSLLAFQDNSSLLSAEQLIKDSRECKVVRPNDESSKALNIFLNARCNQKHESCNEILALEPSSKTDSILFLLSLGDCFLFSAIQNSSEAYDHYISAYEISKKVNSRILLIECLNKIISYNLFAAIIPKETEAFVNQHKEYAYDSLEQLRNDYFQLRLDYPISYDGMIYNPQAIRSWNKQLKIAEDKFPKLESEMRSYYGLYLEANGKYHEAEKELLKSIDAAEKVNDQFYQDAKFSSLANIGYIKLKSKKAAHALDYFKQADAIESRMRSDRNAALLYSWISESYSKMNVMDSAFHYLSLSNDKTRQADDKEHTTKIQEIQSKYDNEKLNNELLVEQGKKQRSNYFMVFFIGLSLISLLVYRNQKIKTKATEKELENAQLKSSLEKQQALEQERVRIAAEMHDDLGGGLTTIKFLSQKVLKSMDSTNDKTKVEKIVAHSKNLVGNMSEIIWAMNSGFDSLESLVAYTRRFASEYLEDHDIGLKFRSEGDLSQIKLSGEKRRSIFLVIKESIHNIVKHAAASKVELTFTVRDKIKIQIQDNGIGFNDETNLLGNGLKNMKNRIEKLEGTIEFKMEEGVCVEILLPVKEEYNDIT